MWSRWLDGGNGRGDGDDRFVPAAKPVRRAPPGAHPARGDPGRADPADRPQPLHRRRVGDRTGRPGPGARGRAGDRRRRPAQSRGSSRTPTSSRSRSIPMSTRSPSAWSVSVARSGIGSAGRPGGCRRSIGRSPSPRPRSSRCVGRRGAGAGARPRHRRAGPGPRGGRIGRPGPAPRLAGRARRRGLHRRHRDPGPGGQRREAGRRWPSAPMAPAPAITRVVYLNGSASGIGGGVVIEGQPLRGRSGFAGELGHTVVNPSGHGVPLRPPGLPGDRGDPRPAAGGPRPDATPTRRPWTADCWRPTHRPAPRSIVSWAG